MSSDGRTSTPMRDRPILDGPSELGVHPASEDGQNGGELTGPHHEISLMCDDIEQTVTELKAKGVAFAWWHLQPGLRPGRPR